MKQNFSYLLLVFCFLIFISSPLFAQSPGSLEYYIKYGREYYETGKYESAATYFEQGVQMYPKNAEVHFYLGQAYLKMKKTEQAKAAFQKAVDLDASLRKRVSEFIGTDDTEIKEESPQNENGESSVLKSRTDNAPFQIGDEVEIKLYTSEAWWRGKVVAVRDQFGDGRAFIYRVHYRDGKIESETEFYPGRVRAIGKASDSQNKDNSNQSRVLFYGDYVCREDLGVSGVTSILSFQAKGVYKFRGSSGRYKYDAATGEVTWTSGYLSADENTTKFRRNKNTAQIDITFKTAKGNLDWSCGTNLK
jgi:tetratricopeptide (TPR) repeat protein